MIEKAINVYEAGESQLIDFMNEIVQKYPNTKLFSLPKIGVNRKIELGVKGEESAVLPAIADIKAGITALGFTWDDC